MSSALLLLGWLTITAQFAAMSAGLVWVGQRRRPRQLRWRRMQAAAVLPLLLLVWLIPASWVFCGWGVLSGLQVRPVGMDAGRVPLPNGYELGAIDGIYSIHSRGGGAALVAEVTQIAVEGGIVFGYTGHGRFVFDTASKHAALADFDALRARQPLGSVHDFPGRRRNVFDALLWSLLWLLPPLLLVRHWWRESARPH